MNRFVIPALGLSAMGAFALLYRFAPDWYFGGLQFWMLHPFSHPFIDWEFMPVAAHCWVQGVNVYLDNTCYLPVAHARFSYSPLWLRFGFLPADERSVQLFGVAIGVAFLASLSLLPPLRRRLDWLVFLAVTFSGLTVFGVERGNVDVLLFTLTVLGTALWCGGMASRSVAYTLLLGVGLLKYYPLVLLILALREKPAHLLLVGTLSTAVVAGFTWWFLPEIRMALAAVPMGSPFTDLFGAGNFRAGLPVMLDYFHADIGLFWPLALLPPAVALGSFVTSLLLAARPDVRHAMERMPARCLGPLVAGAALLVACFFAGQSIGYRGIYFLLTLPGLLCLRREVTEWARALLGATVAAIVFVTSVLSLEAFSVAVGLTRRFDMNSGAAGLLHWLLHEMAWWLIISALVSILFGFVWQAPIAGMARSLLRLPRPLRRWLFPGRVEQAGDVAQFEAGEDYHAPVRSLRRHGSRSARLQKG